MDVTAAVVAWAAFLATAATAGYTYLLARRARQALDETRKQRALAEGQANSARESAEAASKQAHAAVDSARSSRESVELARQAQHRADQPRFDLTGEGHRDGVLQVAARMIAGPPEVQVSGRWKASSGGPPNSEGAHPFDHQEGT